MPPASSRAPAVATAPDAAPRSLSGTPAPGLVAQASQAAAHPGRSAEAWQRRLEIGGLVATLMNTGCGQGLLDRQERRDWEGYDEHRNWHVGLSAATLGLNLASAWKQREVNRHRTEFEFRHTAHNFLVWTKIAGLVGCGVLEVIGEHKRTHGDLDGAHRLGEAMEVTGSLCLGMSLADLVLFGGHDNATIFGCKIAL